MARPFGREDEVWGLYFETGGAGGLSMTGTAEGPLPAGGSALTWQSWPGSG